MPLNKVWNVPKGKWLNLERLRSLSAVRCHPHFDKLNADQRAKMVIEDYNALDNRRPEPSLTIAEYIKQNQ
ncbi:hypothetical protein [Leeuwenhoekiella nanhaiensis]|uniref:Uncharacterized protein n=1 Tax=Leeuwenhoekiella nanhaiensis TaxID=1655491 RepID=A0A2G1VM81_9FLAO|nr:hypothetical protein [Leeuwenhoekiella nanhaiensis]PHQ27871.1 hypothetical protein CJ305_17860 [Leeuwenhoekiella nanhaiensis]